MSIFIDKDTKLLVQGITGRDGSFHAKQMMEYGTKVVAGVTPGKGRPDSSKARCRSSTPWRDAVQATGANTSVIYVPPTFAADAIMEAAAAGVKLIVCITEGVPGARHDEGLSVREGDGRAAARPELPGAHHARPVQGRHHPGPHLHCPGPSASVSRSGTLTYEVVNQLTRAGIGQSTCVGIGGDPINGTNFIDCLAAFEADPQTKAVAMMGEIGGTDEQEAAEFVQGRT